MANTFAYIGGRVDEGQVINFLSKYPFLIDDYMKIINENIRNIKV